MKTSLPRLTIALIFATTMISLACNEAKAQSWVSGPFDGGIFDGGTYQNSNEVLAMYDRNSKGPLGGLFAPNFTRTLTFLGGLNFPSAGAADSITDEAVIPFNIISPVFNSSTNDVDTGYALSFAFGRRHSGNLRSEIEVAFRGNDIDNTTVPFSAVVSFDGTVFIPSSPGGVVTDNGNVNVTSLMKNFFLELDNQSRFTPYAGIGIGISYVDVEFGQAFSFDGEAIFQDGEEVFSYQAIGGVATKINSFTDFIVEYRFLGTSEIEFAGLAEAFNYNTSSLFFGAKFEY